MPYICFIWNVRLCRTLGVGQCYGQGVRSKQGWGNQDVMGWMRKIQVQFQFCFLYDPLFTPATILFFPYLIKHYFKKFLFSSCVFYKPLLIQCFLGSLDVQTNLVFFFFLNLWPFLIPFLRLDLIQESQLPVQLHWFLYVTFLLLIEITLKADFF